MRLCNTDFVMWNCDVSFCHVGNEVEFHGGVFVLVESIVLKFVGIAYTIF